MLLNKLYKIVDQQTDMNNVKTTIVFDPDHDIFKGHFPEQPIVPGVCMIQLVSELMQSAIGVRLRIIEGENIKFLNVVDPREEKNILVDVHYRSNASDFEVSASLQHESTIYFKLKGLFRNA